MNQDEHRLVFVGGLHRSGTTAMTRLLGAHPLVSAFSGTGVKEDEGQHLQDVYPSARSFGGAGRFAADPRAHLTETSPLATAESARRLTEQWSRQWDLSRPVLVEKSPPNLLMTRFLQALFPAARFVVMVRHPAVVTLSTGRWRRTATLDELVGHWLTAHELFREDAPHVRALHVVRYEDLVSEPGRTLREVGQFLELPTAIPRDTLQLHRSQDYEQRWRAISRSRLPGARGRFRRLVDRYEARVRRLGYSLEDLDLNETVTWNPVGTTDAGPAGEVTAPDEASRP